VVEFTFHTFHADLPVIETWGEMMWRPVMMLISMVVGTRVVHKRLRQDGNSKGLSPPAVHMPWL
jgi:hypothetical protein